MTTLRRELRTKFEEVLSKYSDKLTLPEREPLADLLADAALVVSGIAKQTDEKKAEYNVLFRGDYREYPEHLWNIAQALQTDWGFALPAKGKGKEKKNYGFWIMGMDELKTTCGEFGVTVLKELRLSYEDYMSKHEGVAPYTVASPQSLINVARGKAAEMRTQPKIEKPVYKPLPQEDESQYAPRPANIQRPNIKHSASSE